MEWREKGGQRVSWSTIKRRREQTHRGLIDLPLMPTLWEKKEERVVVGLLPLLLSTDVEGRR